MDIVICIMRVYYNVRNNQKWAFAVPLCGLRGRRTAILRAPGPRSLEKRPQIARHTKYYLRLVSAVFFAKQM